MELPHPSGTSSQQPPGASDTLLVRSGLEDAGISRSAFSLTPVSGRSPSLRVRLAHRPSLCGTCNHFTLSMGRILPARGPGGTTRLCPTVSGASAVKTQLKFRIPEEASSAICVAGDAKVTCQMQHNAYTWPLPWPGFSSSMAASGDRVF